MPIKTTITTTRTGPSLSDSVTFPIKCPKCGDETEQLPSRLEQDPKITCPACSEEFTVETNGTAREVANQLKDLDRLIDNFGKS